MEGVGEAAFDERVVRFRGVDVPGSKAYALSAPPKVAAGGRLLLESSSTISDLRLITSMITLHGWRRIGVHFPELHRDLRRCQAKVNTRCSSILPHTICMEKSQNV